MLQLTPRAAQEVQNLWPRNLPDHRILRLAPAGRRSESEARLTIVAVVKPGDHRCESHGITICVAQELAERLSGGTLDVRGAHAGRFYIRTGKPSREAADHRAQPEPSYA